MVTVEHLTKYYGDFLAVDDLSFEIGEGKVYGLLGPNGAGKSTTMNIMTGCLSATEGRVLIDGHDIFEEPEEAKRQIGYLPEQPPLYMSETPNEYLRFVGEAKGLKGEELKQQIAQVVALTGLSDVKNRLISALSKGYKQRVGIAQALLGNPKVIILDEPTVGLDPIQIIEIRDLIKSLGEDHTVILSSHILSEVQLICEKVLIISKGKLVAFDDTQKLEDTAVEDVISLTVEGTPDDVKRILDGVAQVAGYEIGSSADGQTQVTVKTEPETMQEARREISFAFASERLLVVEMTTKKANLEDVFLELTEAGAAEDDRRAAEQEAAEKAAAEKAAAKEAKAAAKAQKAAQKAASAAAAQEAAEEAPAEETAAEEVQEAVTEEEAAAEEAPAEEAAAEEAPAEEESEVRES